MMVSLLATPSKPLVEQLQNGDIVPIQLLAQGVEILDQTQLPHNVVTYTFTRCEQMVDAIRTMIIRGAPAIGIAAAYGLVLSAREHRSQPLETVITTLKRDAETLRSTRPTAVNLMWALARMLRVIDQAGQSSVDELIHALETDALAIHQEDIAMCQAIGDFGATLMTQTSMGILTHCNAGALATGGYGTALGVIRSVFKRDPSVHVYSDETRPRLQGAQLTVWELQQSGIPVTLITDNMAAWTMKQGRIQAVVVGADRIAANGDTANKIGTYSVALAAKAHHIPFYVAAPHSTFDLSLASGEAIPIEERSGDEVRQVNEGLITPEQTHVFNPGFDVTPAELITAIITDKGIAYPPYTHSLSSLLAGV